MSKYKSAVGLEYFEGGKSAPTISVKGKEVMADLIVKIARRYGVPVVEKPAVAKALGLVEIDQEIPEDLYRAVALIVSEMDNPDPGF